MMSDRSPQVVLSLGCMKVAHAVPAASVFSRSRAVSASPLSSFDGAITARGPFQGLIICVTGLSKDARKQVQEATMRMGGEYSPDLHPRCTHLVVQSFGGKKYEHALKHGLRRGLFVVTLSWFVNCVQHNERLEESLYSVKNLVDVGAPLEELSHTIRITNGEHSCLPALPQQEGKTYNLAIRSPSLPLLKEFIKQGALFSGMRFFIDLDSSNELRPKVVEVVAKEGASFIDHWFIGSEATHVVCEGSQSLKYLGFNVNLVTPLWVVKSVRERHLQRLVQISTDLARHISILLDAAQNDHVLEDDCDSHGRKLIAHGTDDDGALQAQIREREEKANAAKSCVRRRRGPRMQPCRTIPRPITPGVLLESVCWSITDPPSAAQFYANGSDGPLVGNGVENEISERGGFLFAVYQDRHDLHTLTGIPEEATYTRPMSVSETKEVVFKASFLTILFPIDRFAEIGLSSRTFHSEKGFERQQILEFVWTFYQEYMTPGEVEVAMYSDSKHADKLRAVYADNDSIQLGYVPMRRYDFLGSRKCFEGLKRVGRENTSQIYELCLGA